MGEMCQRIEGPLQIYCEKEGITEEAAVELLRLKAMEWSEETTVVDRVASWVAKVCQEWMNWKRNEDSCEEYKIN